MTPDIENRSAIKCPRLKNTIGLDVKKFEPVKCVI